MLDERTLVAWIGDAERKKMAKNANFSPRAATKGLVRGLRRADKSFRLCPTTHRRALVGSRRSRGAVPFWSKPSDGHRPPPLPGPLIYTTSTRIYWPQNTMRTCPCPSTETGSHPL